MKIGLLGTGFGVAHAQIYHRHPHVDDVVVFALGTPQSTIAVGVANDTGTSAAEVLLNYPETIVRCSASGLMPKPYGIRGGWRGAFTGAVIESSWTAGYDGRPTTTLTEFTDRVPATSTCPRSTPTRPSSTMSSPAAKAAPSLDLTPGPFSTV